MNDQILIRPLIPSDAETFIKLRHEALEKEPLMFAASVEDDLALSLSFVRQALEDTDKSITFGAFLTELIGVVGIYRESSLKALHKARLWGFYVSPVYRDIGVGGKLLSSAIKYTRNLNGVRQIHLSVNKCAAPALHLYEKLGFQTWGIEPNALFYDGEFMTAHHMLLEV